MLFLLTDSPQKVKLEKINNSFFMQARVLLNYKELGVFLSKATWVYTSSCSKENSRANFKNSIVQENIRISRLKGHYETSTKKKKFESEIKA